MVHDGIVLPSTRSSTLKRGDRVSNWCLAESHYGAVRESTYEVAVLPLGATEPHNLHLPYGTDTLEGDVLGRAVCSAAAERGVRVVLLPTLPYGTQTNMRSLPFAMNINPSTMTRILEDLIASVVASGVRKVLLLNLHGGNELKSVVRELSPRCGAHLFICHWMDVLRDVYDELFDAPEDHAGELETSIALACFPSLVRRDADGGLLADEGAVRPFRFEAMRRGWVQTSRSWEALTTNTGSGNPHGATRKKGEAALEVLVNRLAPFLVELSNAEVDDLFPFDPLESDS